MGREKAESYRKGFAWGRREHYLEKLTNNALAVTILLFVIAFYRNSWYLMYYVFTWLLISSTIHVLARCCHKKERKHHTIANKY